MFVSHEASRTGAPMSLLLVTEWLAAHTDLELEILVLEPGNDGGRLLDDLAAVVPTRLVPSLADPRSRKRLPACDVLVLNSVFSAPALRHLPRQRPYVISRVPELTMSFEHWLDEPDRRLLLEVTDRFVAVSERVKSVLVEEQGVDPGRVAIIPGSVDLARARPPGEQAVAEVRQSLEIAVDALVIGASGTTEWRKGPDLFVRLARMVAGVRPDTDLHFVWVGGRDGGPEFWQIEQAARPDPLADRIHFVGIVADPFPYYGVFDVFALTSREDPFPRVCLEVAALGVPTVAFDNGGAPELLDQGCGSVVPYLDLEAMTDEVVGLLDDPTRRAAVGAVGPDIVRRRYSVDVGGAALLDEIQRGMTAPEPA